MEATAPGEGRSPADPASAATHPRSWPARRAASRGDRGRLDPVPGFVAWRQNRMAPTATKPTPIREALSGSGTDVAAVNLAYSPACFVEPSWPMKPSVDVRPPCVEKPDSIRGQSIVGAADAEGGRAGGVKHRGRRPARGPPLASLATDMHVRAPGAGPRLLGGGDGMGATRTNGGTESPPRPFDAPRPGTPRLELRGITRRFGAVVANEGVDLRVRPGELHALLGENGAGKSTLVKAIYGALQPDEGTILWEGQPVRVPGPRDARRLGIGMVHQHFALFEAMTVLENVALGLDRPGPLPRLAAELEALGARYGLPLDPARPVHALSVGERQRVEVLRCLLQRPRLLVMDEPTSVLTPQEAERLFDALRRLAREGYSVLYISHKLAEVRALCGRATVLRAGRVVAVCDPAVEGTAGLARLMLGETVDRPAVRAGAPARAAAGGAAPARLRVRGLSLPKPSEHGTALRDLSLEVAAGEIVGVAGVAGNGQDELLLALSGETRAARSDAVAVDDRPCGRLGPRARRRLGLYCLPEDRRGHAAVPALTLAENAALSARDRAGLARAGLLRPAAMRRFAARVVEGFGVRCTGPDAAASSLSGGNLQRFLVGREVLQEPGVFVAAQPTWGVDAGAAAGIHRALLELAARGAAVLLVSQDLDELLALCDRLAVIDGGRLSPARPTGEFTVEALGLLMGGVHGDEAAHGHAARVGAPGAAHAD